MKGRGTRAKAGAAAAGVADGEMPPAPKHRMPMDHVRWILAQKPMTPPPCYAALKQRNPDLTPLPGEEANEDLKRLCFLAKAFYEMEERLPKTQAWVRAEMEAKGYVEVSDEWMKRKAAVHALLDREWPKIQAKLEAIVLKDKAEETAQGDADEDYYIEEEEE
ncbi:hypothetical protein EJB05_26861, partial [Eragrostis curvula]